MSGVLIRGEKTQTQTHERRLPCNNRGRDGSDTAVRQGIPKITNHYQKLGRSKEESFPTGFRGRMVLSTS